MSIETIIRNIPSVKKGGLYGIKLSLSEMILISEEYNAAESAVEQANQAVLAASETIQKLVAENARAVVAVTVFSKVTEEITEIICDEIGHEKVAEILGAFNDLGNMPNTDAAIAEIKAHDINLLIDKLSGLPFTIGVSCGYVKEFAANLRAGRKG